MSRTTDGTIRLITHGVNIGSIDATGKTGDTLIRIGKAWIAKGGTPRFVNCGSMTTDTIIRVSTALGGKAVFDLV